MPSTALWSALQSCCCCWQIICSNCSSGKLRLPYSARSEMVCRTCHARARRFYSHLLVDSAAKDSGRGSDASSSSSAQFVNIRDIVFSQHGAEDDVWIAMRCFAEFTLADLSRRRNHTEIVDYGSRKAFCRAPTTHTGRNKNKRRHRRRRHRAGGGGTCPQISDSRGTGAQQNLWGTCNCTKLPQIFGTPTYANMVWH